jgi:hypothetical protein
MRIRIADMSRALQPQADGPERPARDMDEYVPWRLIPPLAGESWRWLCNDGRWVALALGQHEQIGRVVLTASDGRQAIVDSYENALALARDWRD